MQANTLVLCEFLNINRGLYTHTHTHSYVDNDVEGSCSLNKKKVGKVKTTKIFFIIMQQI